MVSFLAASPLLFFYCLSVSIFLIIRQKSLVFFRNQRRREHEISGGSITSYGNIPHYGESQEGFYIGIVGMRFQRVPEKDEKIDISRCNHSSDLLVTPERSTLEFGYFHS